MSAIYGEGHPGGKWLADVLSAMPGEVLKPTLTEREPAVRDRIIAEGDALAKKRDAAHLARKRRCPEEELMKRGIPPLRFKP